MTLGTSLLIILILVLVGALPTWGYSRSWGYGPSGVLGVLVILLLIPGPADQDRYAQSRRPMDMMVHG